MNTFDLHTACPTLKTGEKLAIHTLEPPLTGYAGKVDCWWAEIRDELLGGLLRPWLFTPYFVGEIGGEVAGYMSYHTPADTRDVGLVEFVQTAEKHRRKGVVTVLELLKAGGFSEEARLRNRLRNGQEEMDILVYAASLPGPIRPLRSEGDYYGGRKPWQKERMVASQQQP